MLTLLILIAVLLLAGCVLAFVLGVAIGRVGRDALRLELANLKGKHESLSEAYSHLRELAGHALELAREKHFPAKVQQAERPFNFQRVAPNIKLASDTNCPRCLVSRRSETWPVECDRCGTTFDEFGKLAGLDADIISE